MYENTFSRESEGYNFRDEINNAYDQYSLPPMPKLESDMYQKPGNFI